MNQFVLQSERNF